MTRHNCPVARENKEAHDQFLEYFGSFQREYKAKGSSAALLTKLHQMTESWVVTHICSIDIHLQSCVRQVSDRRSRRHPRRARSTN